MPSYGERRPPPSAAVPTPLTFWLHYRGGKLVFKVR